MLAEGVSIRTALVFCGGGPSRLELEVPEDALVIAADVGAVEAHRLGLAVDLLIGDMDSVPASDLDRVVMSGGVVERHPADKDATDLDLALGAALDAGVERVLVVGGDGGRLDQLMGNALVMASPRFSSIQLDAILGRARVHVIRAERPVHGQPGEIVSLFAVGETARGVHTSGLRWQLEDHDLEPGSSLGVSNAFADRVARIGVREGVLLAVRPGGQ
jgi:thiamine pyrophosphokinase